MTILLLSTALPFYAQSTYGTVFGTVKDSTGAVVSGATVTLSSRDEGTVRTAKTNGSGNYIFQFVPPGHYSVKIVKDGFEEQEIPNQDLAARQPLRVDASMKVGADTQTVTVTENAGVLNTDTAQVSTQLDAKEIESLPTNFHTDGSTSPIVALQALPGVQPDTSTSSNGHPDGLSVEGGLPFQSETTVDGIMTQNVTGNSPLGDAFPSADAIAEIRVDGVLNPASYDQPGEITTISKAGTNDLHGSAFWYHQNRAFDATPYGTTVLPELIANDFGGSGGGPVVFPHLYNGRNRTFFFGDYEGFQFPRGETLQEFFPTQLERNGDFSQEGVTVIDPETGQPFPNDKIPANRISPISQQFLQFFPLPNTGNLNVSHASDYIVNSNNNYNSKQFDARVDQYIGQKQQMFGRFTYKNISENAPQGGLLIPSSVDTDDYRMFVFSHNYSFTHSLMNEFRFGFTLNDRSTSNSTDGRQFTAGLGLQSVGPTFPFNGLPELDFTNVSSLGVDRLNSITQSRLYEYNDNVTWTLGNHYLKAGFDLQKIEAITPLSFFGADNYGTFSFTGAFTGKSFADFLLGIPATTYIDDVQFNNDGNAKYWALYVEDEYPVLHNLTLSYGVRFEDHPGYTDAHGDIGNFDRDIPLSGGVVYPDGYRSILAPGFLQTFNACPGPTENGAPCTPVLSNSQAGLANYLRHAPAYVLPRFGLAWRPFNNDNTVIRSGFGVYEITTLGSVYYSLTGTLQSNTLQFNNVQTANGPAYQWPEIKPGGSNGLIVGPLGSAYFGTANSINWKDPYSMQWLLAVDRNLGSYTALHVSYIALKTDQLVWAPNDNDMSLSEQYAVLRPLSDRPFPNWGTINTRATGAQSDYNTLQVEVSRRFVKGFSIDSTYNWSKNLADNQGPVIGSFAGETGGARSTWLYNRELDYGNVYGTRRNRWLTTSILDLPYGHGRRFGNSASTMVNELLGDWQLSNIFLWQSGPYLTPYFSGGDPSGTGSGSLFGRAQHPDKVGSPVPAGRGANDWISRTAYTCPGTPNYTVGSPCVIGSNPGTPGALPPIGRFGNASVGSIVGPGTVNLSTGLRKVFPITRDMTFQLEGTFTNVLNHVNLADPITNIANPQFGQILSARTSEFGGARTGQISARLTF
ncbi:MAG: carboxypeptidase regulatory-like domain-containing protein [Acidobacteriaceae bacterium]